MSTDRRRNIRVEVDDDLACEIASAEPMRVAQISMTGAQIDTTAPLGSPSNEPDKVIETGPLTHVKRVTET